MEDFIRSVAGQLGIEETAARDATGSLLGLLKDKADGGAVSELFSKLPGAAQMAESAGGGGGGGAGLLGSVGGALGGSLGGSMGALASLAGSGLGSDQIGSLIQQFVGYAKENAGEGIVDKVLAGVPEIQKILG